MKCGMWGFIVKFQTLGRRGLASAVHMARVRARGCQILKLIDLNYFYSDDLS